MGETRRTFLIHAAAAPAFIRGLMAAPRSSTLRLAAFGASNMAFATLDGIATHPNVKLACVADVDATRFKQVKQKYPEARLYEDWREMLTKERGQIDIACVGTPDHMHAPMAMSVMNMGLPVYIQKPLAHDLYEVRRLAEVARKKKLITQMGTQIHSATEYKTAVHVIQSGMIGKVKEVHAWSNKKWGDLEPLPERTDPVPEGLNWDQWLGVCEPRPYIKGIYHPGNWRKRIDFGTATFGDMGCHIYDPVFAALALKSPISVRSEGPAPSKVNWAINAIIHYVFPGTKYTAGKTVNITWYDGDERPSKDVLSILGSRSVPGQGSLFLGTKGAMLLPHVAQPILIGKDVEGLAIEKVDGRDHYHEFVDAVLGKTKTSTALSYSGPLTEAVLLGPLATHFPKTTLEWNGKKLKFKNSSEANALVRRSYRAGWEVKGLSS